MHGKVTQPHGAGLSGPQLGNSTSLLALPVLAALARHLASVLIKVGNQFGGCHGENGCTVVTGSLHSSSRLKFCQMISISCGPFNQFHLDL